MKNLLLTILLISTIVYTSCSSTLSQPIESDPVKVKECYDKIRPVAIEIWPDMSPIDRFANGMKSINLCENVGK